MTLLQHLREPRSLRWRLLIGITLATLVMWVLAALLCYQQTRREIQQLMDGQMAKTARLLLAQIGDNPNHLQNLTENMDSVRGVRVRRRELVLEFRIGTPDGREELRTKNAPDTPLTDSLGYEYIRRDGKPWRSLMLETADGRHRVQVAHSLYSRDKEALEIALKTVLPLALLIAPMLYLIYLSVRRGLKPLDNLAAEVAARSPENLSALQPQAGPLETQPLVQALNSLLDRLASALDNERRFTADAAHELRTPLAALKIQAQVALATTDQGKSRHALTQVLASADRTTRLIEQLLRLARLDPLQAPPNPASVDLPQIATSAVEDMRGLAAARQQQLRLALPAAPVAVTGDADLLAAALRNLIENAVRYTPDGSTITVSVDSNGPPGLVVTDDGPGVPPDELQRLVERFYRGRDVEAEGSGLGLAIVRRIAELHGARLEVGNLPAGGFSAGLRW